MTLRNSESIDGFRLHVTPTSSSWLNLIERWFREITVKRIRPGVYRSIQWLKMAIMACIDGHNERPSPFVWTASAERKLERVRRARIVREDADLVGSRH